MKFVCDGCSEECEEAALTSVGLLEPAAYCAVCLATWRSVERDIARSRVEAIEAFEAARRAILARARATFQRVPDE